MDAEDRRQRTAAATAGACAAVVRRIGGRFAYIGERISIVATAPHMTSGLRWRGAPFVDADEIGGDRGCHVTEDCKRVEGEKEAE